MDTIFAVSSGAPPAAIAVLRISGPRAVDAALALAGHLPPERRASRRTLRDASGTVLDHALVVVFPGPATATGEDLVELHLHGGRAVVAAVETCLAALPGLRRAERGEFTRRALVNGRIDLSEAEGLGDLLTAETEGQRRAAMMALDGGIRRRVNQWSQRVLTCAAQVEAALDFSDEDDVPEAAIQTVQQDIAAIAEDMAHVLSQPPVERLRDGIRIVLAGPPNSGKSSLLNALVDRDAAIVSPIAGTTRDRIDVPVSRDGIAYVISDTAGLAIASDDAIEIIGIERARRAIELADIILWLGDEVPPPGALWLYPRNDQLSRRNPPTNVDVAVSVRTGEGVATLWAMIAERASTLLPREDEVALNARQRDLTENARTALIGASRCDDVLLMAEDLRHALAALDRITGHSDTEAMLDALFGQFCIGK